MLQKFLGLAVAVRFQNYSDQPFVETIINARPVRTSSVNTVMICMAPFNDQLGDFPDSCVLTQDKMTSVHRLYISYNKVGGKKGKLMVFNKTDFFNCTCHNLLFLTIIIGFVMC